MLKVTGFEGSSGGPGGDEHVRMSVSAVAAAAARAGGHR